MKFVKERVNVICQELARLSISQKIKITDMQVKAVERYRSLCR